jgi:hypothetical protein
MANSNYKVNDVQVSYYLAPTHGYDAKFTSSQIA